MNEPKDVDPMSYVLVDGENIDATLGNSLLGRRPSPDERPRWERLTQYISEEWELPVRALFFLNASSGHMPMPFIQALCALGYKPIPLSGDQGEKVVDLGIQRTLDALTERAGNICLASHDGDFLPQVTDLTNQPGRRVALAGFREFFNNGFQELSKQGLEFIDLEQDVRAFTVHLPRVRIIPITEYNPLDYL